MRRRTVLGLLAAPAVARAAEPGEFTVQAGVPVLGYRPAAWRPGGPVLLVLHGAARDADRYRAAWAPLAERHGLLLGCPEFAPEAFPAERGYNLNPAVPALLDGAAEALGAREYLLYGHSAGAQVVHRALLLAGQPRATRIVAANAGWYTMPDEAVPFPHGLGGVGHADLRAVFARPVTVLLGEADTDPHHPQLRRDAATDRQGVTRWDRGLAFYAACRAAAAAHGAGFAWRLATVPGVGHSNAGMAPWAAEILVG